MGGKSFDPIVEKMLEAELFNDSWKTAARLKVEYKDATDTDLSDEEIEGALKRCMTLGITKMHSAQNREGKVVPVYKKNVAVVKGPKQLVVSDDGLSADIVAKETKKES